eukprot:m.131398 g.131398  ORF g.131398 m.131398 type:complete len:90 (-) comp20017_c1_seq13:877-1146(-)
MAAADEKESQLDLSKSVNVWMIRVPNYLAERWDAVSAAGYARVRGWRRVRHAVFTELFVVLVLRLQQRRCGDWHLEDIQESRRFEEAKD